MFRVLVFVFVVSKVVLLATGEKDAVRQSEVATDPRIVDLIDQSRSARLML